MLLVTVRLSVAERHRSSVAQMLRILRGRTTAKVGCRSFHVTQDLMEEDVLTLTERWSTRSELDAHVRSSDYKLLLAVVDLAAAPPEIRFEETESLGGLDMVWAVRSGQRPEEVRVFKEERCFEMMDADDTRPRKGESE